MFRIHAHSLKRFVGLFLLLFPGFLRAGDPAWVPGRLLVGPRQGADSRSVRRALALNRGAVRREMAGLRLSVVEVPEESSAAAIESLRSSGLFQYVERDYYARTGAVPKDPWYSEQWYLQRVEAEPAWDITTGSGSVVVAVIDSGVDATHPDLAAKLVPGWNFLTGTADTTDVLGHGTAVAGTVAASGNNTAGGAGVTWGGMVMPLAVVDASDFASYSNVAAAIQYAADHGARIINISVGGAASSAALQSAVDYAWSKGAVLFASAMNAGSSAPYYPAACNHVAAVSATDASDRLASFSSYGTWLALTAPGANILAPMPGGGYGYWYGTSFSAPIAAGVAALMLSANPSLTNTDVLRLLEQNADDLGALGFDLFFGWGRVNARKAVTAAQQGAIGVSIAPPAITLSAGQTQQFQANVTNSTAGVTWSIDPQAGSISGSGLYAAPAALSSVQSVTVRAVSVAEPTRSASAVITLQPPAVSISLAPANVTLKNSETAQFTAAVSGSNTGVTWALNPNTGTISSSGLYTAPATITSAQTVILTATSVADPAKSASSTIVLQPVVTVSVSPATVTLDQSGAAQFTATVSGSAAGVTWSISPVLGVITNAGLYTAPATITTSQTLTVTATSVADPAKSASALVTLRPPSAPAPNPTPNPPPATSISVSVTPSLVKLKPSDKQQFMATVTGSTAGVTWSISPMVGSISADGAYSAPAYVAMAQSVVVTAASVTDPTKRASATVSLQASPRGKPSGRYPAITHLR